MTTGGMVRVVVSFFLKIDHLPPTYPGGVPSRMGVVWVQIE